MHHHGGLLHADSGDGCLLYTSPSPRDVEECTIDGSKEGSGPKNGEGCYTVSVANNASGRVFDCNGQDGSFANNATITLKNIRIVGPTSQSNSRGVSVYYTNGLHLILDNVYSSAAAYSVNIASANDNIVVDISNSKLVGWCAIQTWSPATINIEDSVLHGTNEYISDNTYTFATMVVNQNSVASKINVKNSEIIAESSDSKDTCQKILNIQNVLNDGNQAYPNGNEIAFTGCEFRAIGTWGNKGSGATYTLEPMYDAIGDNTIIVDGEQYYVPEYNNRIISYLQPQAKINRNGVNTVFGEFELAVDVANPGETIILNDNVELTGKITIDKAITIDGNGKTILAADGFANDHLLLLTAGATVKNVNLDSAGKAKGMQVYQSSTLVEASFENVSFKNSTGSGLTVNGTTVNLKDASFTGNAWQDVNVDSGVGVANDSVLNVGTGCTFAHELQITSDGKKDDAGKYGGKYGTVALNDSAKILSEKSVDVSAKDNDNKDYTYQKKVWTISDKPYIPPYIPPTTPTDNVTNSGTSGTDNATTSADLSGSTSTSNGTTSATVDKTIADKIVDKAVENKSTEVVIDATANTTTAADSTTIAQVTIPTETLGAIAEKTEADVTIKTDVAEVKMDNAAATAVSEQATGDTVQIIAEKVAEEVDKVEFELKVVCSDGKVISNFNGGNIAVTVALPKAMADKKVVCVYIDDNGHMSKVAGQKNDDGTYTFNTGHFSSYAILAEEEADAAIAAQKEAIKNIEIKLTSKQVKTKSGKKGIKITWTAAAGDKVLDGVEVYRSTERYKGYGTEPFYTSTKRGNEGSYINTKSLKKGTRYYYRVRGYVLVDGQKVYTDYSTKAWRTVK